MNSPKRYYAGSEDGRSINFQTEEEIFDGFKLTIRIWHIGVIAAICGMVISAGWMPETTMAEAVPVLDSVDEVDEVDVTTPLDENGFVFGDSSERTLCEEEVAALRGYENPDFQRLVRMAINEIYARHGQVFEAGKTNDVYYRGYTWYDETDKHIVGWEEFNETEKTNLRLLISIEEEYDYR